jgi:hypothetical protein
MAAPTTLCMDGQIDSWCAAGKAEVAGKTAIGKHLIAR